MVAAAVLAFAATVPAATNLLTNGTFEGSGSGSLTGWAVSGGTLSLVTGNGGGHAARVSVSTAGTQAYAYTPSKPVKNLVAGAAYTLDGTVHSTTGGTVCLKLKGVPATGSTTVGSAQPCIAATSTWQAFPSVSRKAAKAGDSLTINVAESSPAAGATFDIDHLVLAAGSTGTDGSGPTVLGNVKASADSSSATTVTWSASTDNVGVTGYDVFRDGTKVQAVGGTTTTFHDSGLQPSTTYSYTVDAFDAAGNTSSKSTAASVTTPATDAPFTHMLATDCRNETNAAGETYPSFPNYLAVMSGTFNTCLARSSNADNMFHQLGAAA